VKRPSPNRIEALARSSGRPRARSTYEGSTLAEVQAEPVDIATLWQASIRADAVIPGTEKLRFPGRRCSRSPLSWRSGIRRRRFAGGLRGIGVEQDAAGPTQRTDLVKRLNNADLVVRRHDRH